MAQSRTAVCLACVIAPAAAAAQGAAPPTLDCALGFEALKAAAQALPGAQSSQYAGFDMITQTLPETWHVSMFFTTRWHPAYPAVAMRTLRKQVTGVWTADSKACGYGNQQQFSALVDDMKASDKALTEASRAEVERKKRGRSPLAAGP